MKTIIYVNQHVLKANKKNGTSNPTITVKTCKRNRYCQEVKILGSSKVVHRPDKPLSCRATVFMSTHTEVELIGEQV